MHCIIFISYKPKKSRTTSKKSMLTAVTVLSVQKNEMKSAQSYRVGLEYVSEIWHC